MLVLSRKKGEEIVVGDHIRIVLVEIRGDRARIGIEADPSISIHRHEVWLSIKDEEDRLENGEEQD